MKKVASIFALSSLLIVAAGCSSNEKNGKEPSEVAIEWVNAQVQKDESKMLELLDKKTEALDADDKSDNDLVVENYKLTQWKASDSRYFYEVVYEHPENGGTDTEKMEIIETDNGWKRTKYSDLANFDTFTADIEPEVLKELHEQ